MGEENDFDVQEFKALLMERRSLLQQVEQTGKDAAEVVELDQSKVGRLSRMDALQGQAMSQEAQRRRVVELQKIQAALRRIEDEEYGYCLKCGEFIGLGRLRVDPGAPYCVKCAD
ncbi:MAG: TraR/DksA family transcriptional regulator [Gammaproteobacteria bacterium]|jgi:DnaK suppressor protein|nr:TraR/DksA family transcriptional regulator [Gammaproteobacteria bacterium]